MKKVINDLNNYFVYKITYKIIYKIMRYYDNNYDSDESVSDNDEQKRFKLENKIEYYEEKLVEIENVYSKIWYSVILPYIYSEKCQILNKLSCDDREDFIEYMVTNSPIYSTVLDKLERLDSKISRLMDS